VTNVFVEQPRKRRWWIGVVIALLVLLLVVAAIVRNRRDERDERVRSSDVPATVAPGGSAPAAPEEPDTNPPEEPSAGEAARNLLVSQLTACGVDVTESTVGGESSEPDFWQITVTTPDDSALFLVSPATNEIRAGDANGDRYIGMCGL
jgi:hypothetical protein